MADNATIMAEQAVVAFMESQKDNVNAALAARYLCLLGLGILVYDICITHQAERRLIWTSTNGFHKYAFLAHRYISAPFLLFSFIFLSGFIGLGFTDSSCQASAALVTAVALISLAVGNGLVLFKVIALWEYDRRIRWLMTGSYAAAYIVSLCTFAAWAAMDIGDVVYTPILSMCILERGSALLIPAWSAPLLFELTVIAVTTWNAVDRPRQIGEGLASTLRMDGLFFFVIMAILRTFQVIMVSTRQARLTLIGVFITWALVNVTVNRSLLSIKRAEQAQSSFLPSPGASRSLPPAKRPEQRVAVDPMSGSIELSRMVDVEMKWD